MCDRDFCGNAISIHALREEGDAVDSVHRLNKIVISIHALREEGDYRTDRQFPNYSISIHALREEGDRHHGYRLRDHPISIHALREEGDIPRKTPALQRKRFLSTPSARRATCASCGFSPFP